jgi:hypothetical protein
MFWEFFAYQNQKPSSIQFPYIYQNKNTINPGLLNTYYGPLSNIDFGEPFLFKIYKCSECFIDVPLMVHAFDSIRAGKNYKHRFDCKSLSTINEDNKNNIDPVNKKLVVETICEIFDHKSVYVKLKIFLKSINIPLYVHRQLKFGYNQSINNKKDSNKNNQNNILNWLQKLAVTEEFIDLENNEENSWANRLIISNNNSTEITKEELIRFINLSNATFGLFRFQKNQNDVYLFFTYLQLEKELN